MTSRGLGPAVAFLTAVGGGRAPSARALRWFPAVGLALGTLLGAVWALAERAWPSPVAAAVVVAADLALTGLLHFDGLVDSADGLLPQLPPERRLAVMAEPAAGAFGVAVGGAALLLRWAALGAVVADVRLLAALWCLSRTAMAVTATTVRYARPGGLAAAFLGGAGGGTGGGTGAALAGGAVASVALALWWDPGAGAAAVTAAVLAAAGVVALARRRVGGFTGDVLGATGVVSETAGLLAAAARW